MRASGDPVRLEDREAKAEEWRKIFDKVEARYKKPNEHSQKLLQRLDGILNKKYPNTDSWEFLKTKKQWEEKVTQYGPIAMAKTLDSPELVYVIIDIPL